MFDDIFKMRNESLLPSSYNLITVKIPVKDSDDKKKRRKLKDKD